MSGMTAPEDPVILVVEDEPDVAATYELWLDTEYEVRIAASGDEALGEIDGSVDVVLLDRMMPGMSGDEVLEELRERGHDCPIAMVSAVDPDFDIVEMGFDTYITKPPTREELKETVERLLERGEHAETVQEYRSMLSKRAALEEEKYESELAESDAYADLQARIESLETELEAEQERLLDDAEFVGALREFEDDEP